MSGGSSLSGSRLIANAYDPANIMGKSGSSFGDNLLDPGGWWGINKEGAMQKKPGEAPGGPDSLPLLPGNYMPFLYSPSSFAARPMGGGYYNNMAARMAGPLYVPRLLSYAPPPMPDAAAQPAPIRRLAPKVLQLHGGSK